MKGFEVYGGSSATIFHGSCLDVLPTLQDESIDLIFADPPYNIGKTFGEFRDRWPSDETYLAWCFDWIGECIKKLKPTGSMYLMSSTQYMPYLDLWLRDKVDIVSRIVWHYDSSGVQARRRFGSLYEPIIHCVKDSKNYTFNSESIEVEAKTGATRNLIDYRKKNPTKYKNTKVPGNTWYMPRVRYRMPEYEEHPSQKPEALLERIVKASSNPGEIVLDPFGGTFTTCAVAQRLDRRTIGIEIESKFIKIGLRRLGIATHLDGELLLGPQKSFVRKNGKVHPSNGSSLVEDKRQSELFDANI